MFSVMATSVGSRSMLDAPKKPTMPSVRSSTYCASSGSASGPPWQSTITSRVHAHGGVAHRLDLLDALVERLGRVRADRALRGQAHVRHEHVGARLGHRDRVVRVEHVRRAQQAERRAPRGSCRPRARSPSRSPRGSRGTCRRSARRSGSSARPRSPASSTWRRKTSISRNGSVPHTPASTGVSRTIGSTSWPISSTIALASPYGIRPASEPRPGHPVAAGVVDDDQVGAAGLGALGRQARCRRPRR